MTKIDQTIKNEFIDQVEANLLISVACKKLNITRQTLSRWRKDDKEFDAEIKSAVKSAVADINDDCENRILAKIKNDDTQAIKLWLKNRHPDYKSQYILGR